MINLTIIQARVATRTLPASTSSKKRPLPGLFQRTNDSSPFRQIALSEGPLSCRLIAASDVGNTLAFVSVWDRFRIMVRHFPRCSLGLQIDQQRRCQTLLAPPKADLSKCETAMDTRNEAAGAGFHSRLFVRPLRNRIGQDFCSWPSRRSVEPQQFGSYRRHSGRCSTFMCSRPSAKSG